MLLSQCTQGFVIDDYSTWYSEHFFMLTSVRGTIMLGMSPWALAVWTTSQSLQSKAMVKVELFLLTNYLISINSQEFRSKMMWGFFGSWYLSLNKPTPNKSSWWHPHMQWGGECVSLEPCQNPVAMISASLQSPTWEDWVQHLLQCRAAANSRWPRADSSLWGLKLQQIKEPSLRKRNMKSPNQNKVRKWLFQMREGVKTNHKCLKDINATNSQHWKNFHLHCSVIFFSLYIHCILFDILFTWWQFSVTLCVARREN